MRPIRIYIYAMGTRHYRESVYCGGCPAIGKKLVKHIDGVTKKEGECRVIRAFAKQIPAGSTIEIVCSSYLTVMEIRGYLEAVRTVRRYRRVYISAIVGTGVYHWAWYISPTKKRFDTRVASSKAEALWFCLWDLIDHLPEEENVKVLVDSLEFSAQFYGVAPIPSKLRWVCDNVRDPGFPLIGVPRAYNKASKALRRRFQ